MLPEYPVSNQKSVSVPTLKLKCSRSDVILLTKSMRNYLRKKIHFCYFALSELYVQEVLSNIHSIHTLCQWLLGHSIRQFYLNFLLVFHLFLVIPPSLLPRTPGKSINKNLSDPARCSRFTIHWEQRRAQVASILPPSPPPPSESRVLYPFVLKCSCFCSEVALPLCSEVF